MEEPTEAQIKELWEWCGFVQLPVGKNGFHWERSMRVGNWMPPDVLPSDIFKSMPYLPPIDLNSLFAYAVPRVVGSYLVVLESYTTHNPPRLEYTVMLQDDPLRIYETTAEDPALALFWAIYSVIKEVKKWKNG